MKSLAPTDDGKGCWLGYVTHSNPKGKLPSWVINRLASSYAPRMVKRLHKACLEYPGWKANHSPGLKYWINPEQIASTPKIDLNDVSTSWARVPIRSIKTIRTTLGDLHWQLFSFTPRLHVGYSQLYGTKPDYLSYIILPKLCKTVRVLFSKNCDT